jgi:hypothetical protein
MHFKISIGVGSILPSKMSEDTKKINSKVLGLSE